MIHNKTLKNPPFENLTGCYLAGGAILSSVTGVEINDYDIYPKDQTKIFDLIYYFIEDENMTLVGETDRSLTFKANHMLDSEGRRKLIQIIKIKDFKTPEDIYNTFDFTVCMALYDYDSKSYHFHESFYPDVAARRINFNVDTKYPYASLVRVKKYAEKGYKISKAESIKIGMSIARVGLPDSWDSLSNAIGGIYGKAVEIGEDKEYTFDNAIEELSNVVIKEPVEDDTLHKQMAKITKNCNPQLAYDLFYKNKKEESIDVVRLGSSYYYIENGLITDDVISYEKNSYYADYASNSLIGNDYNKKNRRIFEAVKYTNVNNVVMDLDVYVVIVDNKLLNCKKVGYRTEFEKIEFSIGDVCSDNLIVFRNMADAMKIRDKCISLHKDENESIRFYKATVSSQNIRHSFNNDILVGRNVEIKGL